MPLISVRIKAVQAQLAEIINALPKVWVATAQKYTWLLMHMAIQLNLLWVMVLRTILK